MIRGPNQIESEIFTKKWTPQKDEVGHFGCLYEKNHEIPIKMAISIHILSHVPCVAPTCHVHENAGFWPKFFKKGGATFAKICAARQFSKMYGQFK